MAINTLDNYIAAVKQRVQYCKRTSRTTVANGWFSMFDLAGQPGAGVLAGSNTESGVVPTDAIAGYPLISAFGAGTTGYLSKLEFANTVACRISIFDRLFVAGAYAFNASTTLSSIPTFISRLPNNDYTDLEIWIEQVTAATGNQAVSVGYTNQAGTSERTTGAVGIGSAPTVGRCWQLPLQAGDSGIQTINTVTGSVATVGTFNVMVLRPLWSGRVPLANGGDVHDMLRTGLPLVYDSSSLFILVCPDSTSSGIPELSMEIANG